MAFNPLISLILCVKNGMPYLPLAIESVGAQTYRHFEVIVQDAASTDGSLEYLKQVQGLPAVEIVSALDGGIGDAYNRALGRCTGELIGSIDADNLLEPDALEKACARFTEHPNCAAFYGTSHLIDPDGKPLGTFPPPAFDLLGLLQCEVVPPFAVSFFSRRKCGAELRFDETLKTCADFDLWLRLGYLPIVMVPDVFGSTRHSSKSMSCRPEAYEQFCADKLDALRRYQARQRKDPMAENVFKLGAAGIYAWAADSILRMEGRSTRYEHFLQRAVEHDPSPKTLRRLTGNQSPSSACEAVRTLPPQPPPAASSLPPTTPLAAPELPADTVEFFDLLHARCGRMLNRQEPIQDKEILEAMDALTLLFSATDKIDYIRRCGCLLPPAVLPLLIQQIGAAWSAKNSQLAEALESIFGQLTQSSDRGGTALEQMPPSGVPPAQPATPTHHGVFSRFKPWEGLVEAGFIADFLGLATRTRFFNLIGAHPQSEFLSPPLPAFSEEYFEWIDVLESVLNARDHFVMIELGAGWGRWLAIAGAAWRQRSNQPCLLIGVEAEPDHFQWMKLHFQDNGFDPNQHHLIEAAVAEQDGSVMFHVGKANEWYGQAIAANESAPSPSIRSVPAVCLNTLLEPFDRVDLIDLDVQNAELLVLAAAAANLDRRVKRVHIGTHSPEVEAGLRGLFRGMGWCCLNDYPCAGPSETPYGPIEFGDGVQSWENPKLA